VIPLGSVSSLLKGMSQAFCVGMLLFPCACFSGAASSTAELSLFAIQNNVLSGPPGTLDTTFGNGQGYVTQTMPSANLNSINYNPSINPVGTFIAYDSAGAYLVVGSGVDASTSLNEVFVWRHLADGTPDTSYGTNGYYEWNPCVQNMYPAGVVIQPDGKALISGQIDYCVSGLSTAILRLGASGSPDLGFGGGQPATFVFKPGSNDMAPQMILNSDCSVYAGSYGDCCGAAMDFLPLKITPSGALDSTWAAPNGYLNINAIGGGFSNSDDRGGDFRGSIALDSSGNLWEAGRTICASGNYCLAVVRVKSDGSALDSNWNGTGMLSLDAFGGATSAVPKQTAEAIVTDSSNRLVVAARGWNGTNSNIVVLRFNWDGTLDTTFGSNGSVVINGSGGDDIPASVLIDSSNRILVSGYVTISGIQYAAILRFDSSGNQDMSFGTNGMWIAGAAGGVSSAGQMTFDPQGRIVVAGTLWNGSMNVEAIWRIWNT